jgi:hypothetical protein
MLVACTDVGVRVENCCVSVTTVYAPEANEVNFFYLKF